MGGILSKLAQPVSQSDNDRWLTTISPIKGELRAAMVGVAAGAFFHESRFGLKWERDQIMVPLQRWWSSKTVSSVMHGLSMFADELMVPYFAVLYWCASNSAQRAPAPLSLFLLNFQGQHHCSISQLPHLPRFPIRSTHLRS